MFEFLVGIQALMEYAEQVEVHHKRRAEQRAVRNVRLKLNIALRNFIYHYVVFKYFYRF
jgi:hypothetical protein